MIADSTDIKFACSQCGQRIVVEKSGAGLTADCPICSNPVTVPYVSSIHDRHYGEPVAEHEHGSRTSFADPGPEEMREELIDATVQTGRLEQELEAARCEIARQQALFKKAVDECERLTANTTHAQAEIKSFQSDRQQLKADLANARQRALGAETKLVELTAALAGADQENAALRDQIENDLAVTHERLAATDTQLAARERELRAALAENSEIVLALSATQAELASARAEAAGLSHDVQALRVEATSTGELLTATRQELQDVQTRLDAASAERRELNAERDSLSQQVQILRQDLAQTGAGPELLELRARVQELNEDRQRTTDKLAAQAAELGTLTAAEQKLRAELEEARCLQLETERRLEANSETQLKKDNDVLRGIVARLNTTLGVYHTEIRRQRRARLTLRLLYALFALGLVTLAIFAVYVFGPHAVGILSIQ
jgi:chromosome segregation ATPase